MPQGVPALKSHLVATRNLLLGTCNLLILPLPEGWRLVDGYSPPEVDRWVKRDGVAWATAGRGSYRVVASSGRPDDHRPRVLSLDVRLAPAGNSGSPEPWGAEPARVREAGSGTLAGHRARWALGEVLRGFPRRLRPALAIRLECPETGRRIDLLFEGEDAALQEEVLAALRQGPVCHG